LQEWDLRWIKKGKHGKRINENCSFIFFLKLIIISIVYHITDEAWGTVKKATTVPIAAVPNLEKGWSWKQKLCPDVRWIILVCGSDQLCVNRQFRASNWNLDRAKVRVAEKCTRTWLIEVRFKADSQEHNLRQPVRGIEEFNMYELSNHHQRWPLGI
jgi:hypothetical protein